jgi:hypothetical protein
MKIKSLVLVALVLSMLFVLSVSVAAAAPGNPGPQPWMGQDGGNVKSFHADALEIPELADGRVWGATTSASRTP